MKKNAFQAILSLGVAVALIAAVFALVAVANPLTPAQRASADSLGGIINQQKYPALLAGTQAYTTTPKYSSAVYVDGWGSVNVMVANVVTGSQTITVTPQFSLQDAACTSVTQWFTATSYMAYQPYSVSSNSNTITETVGPWQMTPVVEQFTVTGSNVAQREFSVPGTCMRVRLEFSNAGQTYTPTVIIRTIDRN